MVLSPPNISANGTASLDLSLYSARGGEPTTVQWTFEYPSSRIQSLAVDEGPALTSAGKTAMCSGDGAAYNCVAVGTNTKAIGNGIIAKLTAVLAPGATAAAIQIKSPLGASSAGYLIPIRSIVLSGSGADVPSDCKPQPPKRAPVRK